MVDRTVYANDKTPDLPLRQVYRAANVFIKIFVAWLLTLGLLTVETFAMLGDDIASVKATLKNLVPDHARFGTDAPAQELALTSLGRSVEDLQHYAGSFCSSQGEDGRRSIESA